jgi:hypothetical protein
VRRVVVEDEDPPGSSGVSWGGLLLRLAPCTGSSGELAIGAMEGLIDAIGVARSAVVRRGRSWRAQISGRSSPFIVARQCRRAELGRRRRRRSNVAKGQGMGATGCWCPGEADARDGGEDEGLQRR